MKIVVDTSALMDSLQKIDELADQHDIIVPYVVLLELEKHKDNHKDSKRAYLGRAALRLLDKEQDKFIFDLEEYSDSELKNDDIIIMVAQKHKAKLATVDLSMRQKAKLLGVDSIRVNHRDDNYKGYTIINVEDCPEKVSDLYSDISKNHFDLHINEYLIIKECGQTKDICRWNGVEHVHLKLPDRSVIEGYNDLQKCALDLLNDDTIPVKIIAGTFGSGKTKLATTLGYEKVMRGLYSKLVFVRNTDTSDTGDIGFLPGTFEDKTDLLFQTMYQHLPQTIDTAHFMKSQGLLETHIPYFMKGLSLSGFMIVDEAEDLTTDTIKKVGTRLEEESCVVFCGDWEQAKGKFVADSGIKKIIHETKDNPLVGVVVLNDVVRSKVSEIFAQL